jgi:hypothetical protein
MSLTEYFPYFLVPLIEDLKDWTTLGKETFKLSPGNIDVFIKRRVLVSTIGDITGIMFLIFARASNR